MGNGISLDKIYVYFGTNANANTTDIYFYCDNCAYVYKQDVWNSMEFHYCKYYIHFSLPDHLSLLPYHISYHYVTILFVLMSYFFVSRRSKAL